MSKLLNLRSWFDLHDAATILATAFGEKVSDVDVLRLALDKQLKISIRLINEAYGRECREIQPSDIEWREIPSLDGKRTLKLPVNGKTLYFEETETLYHINGPVHSLDGIYDLPMIGGERVDVEFKFNQIKFDPVPTMVSLEGVMVQSPDGKLYELQTRHEKPESFSFTDPGNFHPAGALPEDYIFVIRKECLDDFVRQHSANPVETEKPLGTRERATLLNIIGALLEKYVKKDEPLIDEIQQEYPAVPGLKTRTLQEKFADARRSLKSN